MSELMFVEADLVQIKEDKQTIEKIFAEIEIFKSNFPFTKINRSCQVGDGIIAIPEEAFAEYLFLHQKACSDGRLMKFVPASGAASRMFKFLQSCQLESLDPDYLLKKVNEGVSDYLNLEKFLKNIHKFSFFADLQEVLAKQGISLLEKLEKKDYRPIITNLLALPGLNYSHLPKALIKFHHYSDYDRTALEEHLVEGVHYTSDFQGKVRIHFTISPEHLILFQSLLASLQSAYEEHYSVNFAISFSEQKKSTDTIAVDLENKPFRDQNGKLVFRPAGHGALIENLGEIDGDIVFIKNIDNVVPDQLKDKTILYKKILCGYLLKIQEKIFFYLSKLSANDFSLELLAEIRSFAEKELNVFLPENLIEVQAKNIADFFFEKLNRPLRVCGMVKNEGEPGGGPFWIEDSDGSLSLQIVETSQIDVKTSEQKQKLSEATHFNPVDLVCGLKNFRGESFNLKEFVDPKTGFIAIKSKNGRDLKSLELPGLWNGAMAKWNTIFVEVPVITFNPVKTVNDLLRQEHQIV